MFESGFRHVPVVEWTAGGHGLRARRARPVQEFEAELQRKTQIGEILG
jgi:hypothetical protein